MSPDGRIMGRGEGPSGVERVGRGCCGMDIKEEKWYRGDGL